MMMARFYLVAPALGGYEYELLKVRFNLEPYPAIISGVGDEEDIQVKDEAEFLEKLEEILSSDQVHNIVGALLAQSAAVAEKEEGDPLS